MWECVPKEFTIRERKAPCLPLLRMPEYPETLVVAVEAVEGLLVASAGPVDVDAAWTIAAWQIAAGDFGAARGTVARVWAAPRPLAGQLLGAHLLAVIDALWQPPEDERPEGFPDPLEAYRGIFRAAETAEQAVRVEAGIALASTVHPFNAKKAFELLERVKPLVAGDDERMHAHIELGLAAVAVAMDGPSDERSDDIDARTFLEHARARFEKCEHHLGLAQCALVEYQLEAHGQNRIETRCRLLEEAWYRYCADGRDAAAARTITFGLLPLHVDRVRSPDLAIAELLETATRNAARAGSFRELQSVFRMADRLGFRAVVRHIDIGSGTTFERAH